MLKLASNLNSWINEPRWFQHCLTTDMQDVVRTMTNLATIAGNKDTTRDGFLGNKIEVLQPVASGHRAGLDAILLAASLPPDISGQLADLGSGAGTAGIAAIALRPQLSVVLVENDPQMVHLARQTSKLSKNANLRSRIDVLQADITLSGVRRQQAGLADCSFEYVIMNPPYNDATTHKVSSDGIKAKAHIMGSGGLDAWMRTATSILKPGGILAMIHRSQSIGQIIAATQGRFGALTIVPIHSRADDNAKRLLVRAIKGSKAALTFAPPIVIHNDDGSFTPKAEAVMAGEEFLF